QLGRDARDADLVEFVERHERLAVQCGWNAHALEHGRERMPMVETYGEVGEAQPRKNLSRGRQQVGLDHERRRPDGIDVALVELAIAAARGPVGTPYRLNLVALE